jgi:hypothetical protein
MAEWENQWENLLRNPPMFADVFRRPNRLGATQDQARELRANAQVSQASKSNAASSQRFRSLKAWASKGDYRAWEHLLRIHE